MLMKYLKLKFLMVLLALAAAIPSAWAETTVIASADYTQNSDADESGIVYTGDGTWTYDASISYSYVYWRKANSGITYTCGSFTGNTAIVTVTTSSSYGYGNLTINGVSKSLTNGSTTDYEISIGSDRTIKFTTSDSYSPNITAIVIKAESGGGGDDPTPTTKTASIVFGDNESDGNQDFATMNSGSVDLAAFLDYTTEGADLITGIQCSKVYKGATGLKFSSSSVDGYLIITLAPNWKATKITVNAKKWTSGNGKIQIIAGDKTSTNYTLTADYADYDLAFDEATSIPTIRISATNRLYVKSITIEYVEDGTVEPTLQEVTLSFPQDAYTATLGEDFTAPVLTVDPSAAADEVVYSSSNAAVATVAADGTVTLLGAGTTTITASISDSETYEDASASYTLTVEEAVQPGSNEYVLVTNINQLAHGKKILFLNANSQNYYAEAMGRQQSNNRKTTTVEVSENKVTTPVADTEILNLEKDGDYWLFKTTKWPEGGLGYLYAAGANSNNYLKTETTADNRAQATVTIADNGEATVVFNLSGDNPRNILRHNSSSSIYSCYNSSGASSQKPVYIYVEKSNNPVVEPVDPELSFGETTSYNLTFGDTFTAPTLTNPNEVEVSYSSNNTNVATVDATTGAVTIVGPGTAVITATFEGNDSYLPDEASYTINVAPKPELVVSPEELILDAENNTIEVIGENLKGDVTVTVNNENFTVSPATISKAAAEEGATVTVTYTGTDVDGEEGVITFTTEGIDPITVNVLAAAPKPVLTVDEEVEFNILVGETKTETFGVMGENLQGDITLTLNDETGYFTINPTTISKDDAELAEVTVTYTPQAEGIHEATVTVSSPKADSKTVTLTALATAPIPVEVAAPTFTPEPGSYIEAKTVTIACETEDAEIYFSTDGGENWTQGNSVLVDHDMTLMAKAVKGKVETPAMAVYSFEFPVEPINIDPIEGYFQVKNLGNEKYANVVGRRTLRFTDAPADKAGTVIRIKTDEHGKVLQLRSQAADLQRYADRAMTYVPEFVHLVAQTLDMEDGAGSLFGENGLDMILDKFNECFDAHLYVEPADGGYRIYGKTPSMQHVVQFYRDNQAKVDAKLPKLEDAINHAIEKLLDKTNGSGASVIGDGFSLHQVWENMNNPYLIEPQDDASTMAFYHQVLMNKDFVWDFAYQTAMMYWPKLKEHPKFQDFVNQMGEVANYIDKIEQIRPNFKYYIVQKNDKPDFISEGNVDIKNNAARTIWSVEPRSTFVVNIPEENVVKDKYVTTLYTDFAYTLPEGVEAYILKGIIGSGFAVPEKLGSTTVPAQTPILLMATEAGNQDLAIENNDGSPVQGNILVGPDYLIRTYQLKSSTAVKLFDVVKTLFGQEIYDRYMQKYEYLQLRYSGMVNNRYFWGISEDDVKTYCIYIDENEEENCVVRSLDVQDGECAFYNNFAVNTNKAFIVNETFDKVKLMFVGDVNKDGVISVADVTALIDLLLIGPETRYYENPTPEYPNGLDYEAADINGNGEISVLDTSDLIDFLLVEQGIEPYVEPEEGD